MPPIKPMVYEMCFQSDTDDKENWLLMLLQLLYRKSPLDFSQKKPCRVIAGLRSSKGNFLLSTGL